LGICLFNFFCTSYIDICTFNVRGIKYTCNVYPSSQATQYSCTLKTAANLHNKLFKIVLTSLCILIFNISNQIQISSTITFPPKSKCYYNSNLRYFKIRNSNLVPKLKFVLSFIIHVCSM
jgi:hypothetical protein